MFYYPRIQNKSQREKKIPAVITFHCVYRYIFSGNTICCCIQTPHTLIKGMRTVQFSSLETKANIYNMYIKCTVKYMQSCISWLKFWFYFIFFIFFLLLFIFIWGGGVFPLKLKKKQKMKRQFKIRFYHLNFVVHV